MFTNSGLVIAFDNSDLDLAITKAIANDTLYIHHKFTSNLIFLTLRRKVIKFSTSVQIIGLFYPKIYE